MFRIVHHLVRGDGACAVSLWPSQHGLDVASLVSLPMRLIALTLAGWLRRYDEEIVAYLLAENRMLRERLGPGRLRLATGEKRRLARAAHNLSRKTLLALATIVTPDTLRKWYRQLVAAKYDGSAKRGPGRPRKRDALAALVVRMATENPTWGYTRIKGALYNLGHEVGRNTVARILAEHGIDPAPERGQRMPWRTFLAAHWGAIAAADFFTVEVLTLVGLIRYHVLFVMDLKTRVVEIAGIRVNPNSEWMSQVARNLTDELDGFLTNHRYLIIDRDSLYDAAFCRILGYSKVNVVRLPRGSPDLNAYAERFVRSIKSECLSKIIPLGEGHLRRAVVEYVEHYHLERNHQGLGNELLHPAKPQRPDGPIQRRERLGGLLSFYHRDAA
jgi:transposase InsO family protein